MKALRALVVDDVEGMRRYVRTILESCGFDCLEARDGIEALKFASDEGVDLIVTDIEMPRMDGLELLRLVHRGAFGDRPPPVIVCSGLLADAATADLPDLKLSAAIVPKPFLADQLLAAVEAAFAGN